MSILCSHVFLAFNFIRLVVTHVQMQCRSETFRLIHVYAAYEIRRRLKEIKG